ncbi:MAG: shikimate dehydrogenase [Oscillospiraceae bacterium]
MSENHDILFRQRPLDGLTVTVGTLGYPVHHTISPEFQGAAYEVTGTDMVYLPFNVKPEDIGDAVRGIRALGIRGTNVTMPHKQTAMKFLDELDPLAEAVGSINGIINTDGVLKGYNFDVGGFMIPFEGMDLNGVRILQLGAGGGGRAAAFGMSVRGADLVILNREPEAAESLAKDVSAYSGNPARGGAFTVENIARELADAEVLVNCTSIGFDKQEGQTPVPKELLRPDLFVYDIVYSPLETRLMREAREAGAKRVVGGLEMIVGQGAQFFEKATGKKAPYELMLETGRKALLARQEEER